MINPRSLALVAFALMLAIAGCGRGGPELGLVHGKVTLDGKPLVGACVGFYPKAGGRQAVSMTDEGGNYELQFTGDVSGAVTGINEVTVFWPDSGERTGVIPEEYNKKSQLTFDVKPSDNTFDIDMKSK